MTFPLVVLAGLMLMGCEKPENTMTEYTRRRLLQEEVRKARTEIEATSIPPMTEMIGPIIVGPTGLTIDLPAGATIYMIRLSGGQLVLNKKS